jgi:hypothetical protein
MEIPAQTGGVGVTLFTVICPFTPNPKNKKIKTENTEVKILRNVNLLHTGMVSEVAVCFEV